MVMAPTLCKKTNKINLKALHPVLSIYFEVDPSQGLIRSNSRSLMLKVIVKDLPPSVTHVITLQHMKCCCGFTHNSVACHAARRQLYQVSLQSEVLAVFHPNCPSQMVLDHPFDPQQEFPRTNWNLNERRRCCLPRAAYH